MSDDDWGWENDWNDNNSNINILNNDNAFNFVNIQEQIRLLENRELEKKADNYLMDELFSDNTFKIESDKSVFDINNQVNIKQNNKNIKNINKKQLNSKKQNNYKIQNYYKNKELNENKKKELIKIQNNKKIKNNEKNDIFGEYDDDNLDIYCNIEDKYIK